MRWIPPQARDECSGHRWVYPGCCTAAEHTTRRKTYHTILATFTGIACEIWQTRYSTFVHAQQGVAGSAEARRKSVT